MTDWTEYLAHRTRRAEAALARARKRLEDAEAVLAPAEAEHLAEGDGYVGEYLLGLRRDYRVASQSVARAEDGLAAARSRQTSATLPGLEVIE